MNRRAVLAGAAVLAAGCLSPRRYPVTTPAPVRNVTFDPDVGGGEEGAPTITVEGSTVVVEGTMQTGTPCYEAVLERVAFDEAAARLDVVVGVGKSGFHPDRDPVRRLLGGGCPDVMEVDTYRVAVDFPSVDAVPAAVTATHRPVASDVRSSTWRA